MHFMNPVLALLPRVLVRPGYEATHLVLRLLHVHASVGLLVCSSTLIMCTELFHWNFAGSIGQGTSR